MKHLALLLALFAAPAHAHIPEHCLPLWRAVQDETTIVLRHLIRFGRRRMQPRALLTRGAVIFH